MVKALFLFSDVEGKAEDFVSFHLILFKYKTQLKNFTFTFGKKLIEETVSMVLAFRKDLARHHLIGYVVAQLIGAALGAWVAHAMFELEILQWSTKVRTGPAQWFAEAVATGGLIFVILRSPAGKASAIVACYIGAAYWFTASTSFANPAAAFGRMFTDTFAGIAPLKNLILPNSPLALPVSRLNRMIVWTFPEPGTHSFE